MGCNCGKKKQQQKQQPPQSSEQSNSSSRQTFTLDTGARVQTFGSRLEAEAAWVRNGRKGVVRPA